MSPSHKSKSILLLATFSILVLTVLSIADLQLTAENSVDPDPNPALTFNESGKPEGSSFSVDGAVLKDDGTYSCIKGDIITITYVPGSQTSCVSSWGYSESEGRKITILKETAFVLKLSLSGDETIQPGFTTTHITKVSTWAGMIEVCSDINKNCGEDIIPTIIVDTGGSLARMNNNQLIINHSLRIVGDNSSGKNGFIRQSPTKNGDNVVPTIQILSGTVYMTGITLDGGATWVNSADSGLPKMIQNVLQRGDVNNGVETDQPFISNKGSLYLQDELVIQNAYNTYTSPDSSNNGGALFSSGYVSFEGVLIKDCFALRGSAAYCIMENDKKLVVGGNTIITHNGGLNCELGSAIYVLRGQLEIESGKINENFGAFAFACAQGVTVKGGEICGNVSKAADNSHCSGQDKYCGVFYIFGGNFSIEGGYIMSNKTYKTDDYNGLYSGIVFQSRGNMTMTGGTICDNVVYKNFSVLGSDIEWANGTKCDLIFRSGGGVLTMTGGSLEAVSGADRTITAVAVSTSDNYKAGIVVKDLKNSGGTSLGWICKDVVTDSEGYIYVSLSGIVSVETEVLIDLIGKPVIDGNPIAGNTLSVIFPQTSNFTCKWWIKDEPESEPRLISNHTTYVVKSDDFGKQIYVVVTGTNGYVGSEDSDPLRIGIQFVISYGTGTSMTISDSIFNYVPGELVVLTTEVPSWEGNIKHFIGWKFSDDERVYAPGANMDLSPYISGSHFRMMYAVWEDNAVDVFCNQGLVIKKGGDHVIFDILEAPAGKVFVGWSCNGTIYATGQMLGTSDNVRHFEAVFIDDTYHGTLIIGPVQSPPSLEEPSSES